MGDTLQQSMFEAIETELKRQAARLDQPSTRRFHDMLTYHMGWTGAGAGAQATGKRIRPLIALLSAASIKNEEGNSADSWRHAVSFAAATELVHNFSLAHDDIQDNSQLRRGRKTIWVKWGAPMAINAGDALFVMANQAALDLKAFYPAEITLRAAGILNDCCLDLTRGQYLDMSYEKRVGLSLEDYWRMIGGKTSALISACTQGGALLGYAQEDRVELYRLFGYTLGLAFQVQDDILGIWGDESVTGKSAASDLAEGKNSLPVVYALERNGGFAKRWKQGAITQAEVAAAAASLEKEGSKVYAEKMSVELTDEALGYLKRADPQGEAGEALLGLATLLLKRNQ